MVFVWRNMNQFFKSILEKVITAIILAFVAMYFDNMYKSDNIGEGLKTTTINNETIELKSLIIKLEQSHIKLIELINKNTIVNIKNTDAINVSNPINSQQKWNNILGISWLKNKNILGFNMELDVEKYNSNIPLIISLENLDSTKASIVIMDKNKKLIKKMTLKVQENELFTYKGKEYKFNIINIRKTGFINTLAMYFSIDIKG